MPFTGCVAAAAAATNYEDVEWIGDRPGLCRSCIFLELLPYLATTLMVSKMRSQLNFTSERCVTG